MKKVIIFLSFFYFIQTFSQERTIIVVDALTNNPIKEVGVYSENNLICVSNQLGTIRINQNIKGNLNIVKEDYYDASLKSNTLKDTLKLYKIESIELKEVIITPVKVKNILDSVYKNQISWKKFKFSKHTQFYNLFKSDYDTLIYINKRILFNKEGSPKVENSEKIVPNFKLNSKGQPIYFLNKSQLIFNLGYNHAGLPHNSVEFQFVTHFQDYFNYTIEKNDAFYKISFERRKKNSEFPYYGFMIVDMEDYGIHEMSFSTQINKGFKKNITLNNKILNYRILKEESSIKYSKNEDGMYELVKYAFDTEFISLDGNTKGRVFTNKCRKETTLDFQNTNLHTIDLFNYKVE